MKRNDNISTFTDTNYLYEVYSNDDGLPVRVIKWDLHDDGPPLEDTRHYGYIDQLLREAGQPNAIDIIMDQMMHEYQREIDRDQADQH